MEKEIVVVDDISSSAEESFTL